MKTLNTAWSLTALLSIFSTPVALARGGADIGGGNGSPAKIIRITAAGLDSLAGRDITVRGRKIDIAAMQAALAGLQEIRPTSEQLAPVNGKPVCLVNHPEAKMLEMNVPCFDAYDEDTKLQMGFHETWGLAFHDGADDTYFFSAKMVEALKNVPESESATMIVQVPGFALKFASVDDYNKNPGELERQAREVAETNAADNCRLRDGVGRGQPDTVLSGRKFFAGVDYSLQADSTIRCEVARPKKLPLLGIQAITTDDTYLVATNLTVAGREALLALTQNPKAKKYVSRECLNQAVQNSKNIAQDPELQKLKADIEAKIGAFSLVYDLHMANVRLDEHGNLPYPPKPAQGDLSIYTADPALLQQHNGVTVDFNKIYFAMASKMRGGDGSFAMVTDNVDCQVQKESVKKFLGFLKDYLTTDEESLSTNDD